MRRGGNFLSRRSETGSFARSISSARENHAANPPRITRRNRGVANAAARAQTPVVCGSQKKIMNICVVIPVFNHANTLPAVARAAQKYFPVIVADDGSTDYPHPPEDTAIVQLEQNHGK